MCIMHESGLAWSWLPNLKFISNEGPLKSSKDIGMKIFPFGCFKKLKLVLIVMNIAMTTHMTLEQTHQFICAHTASSPCFLTHS